MHRTLGVATPRFAGFDFTAHMRPICADMVARLPELAHIDVDQVAIRFCQVRSAARHGMHASLTPLRFENGQSTTVRRGRRWKIDRVVDSAGREMLYLLSFYLPRFLETNLREKLETVIHELWHISPAFDGDLRRHRGRCYAHSPSQRQYDAVIDGLTSKWLSLGPGLDLYDFLACNFAQLQQRHGAVYGQRIPTPKLRRVD